MIKNILCLVVSFTFISGVWAQFTDVSSIADFHRKLLTLDSHTDTPLRLVREEFDFMADNRGKWGSKVDFPRMEEGA